MVLLWTFSEPSPGLSHMCEECWAGILDVFLPVRCPDNLVICFASPRPAMGKSQPHCSSVRLHMMVALSPQTGLQDPTCSRSLLASVSSSCNKAAVHLPESPSNGWGRQLGLHHLWDAVGELHDACREQWEYLNTLGCFITVFAFWFWFFCWIFF